MHVPVLLKEVIEFLDPKPGEVMLDATINGGGHARAILEKVAPNGKLIGIDQDQQLLDSLISKSEFLISRQKGNLILINGNFRNLDELLSSAGIEAVDGILFDLGMSSYQMEKSGRGFSFQKEEPLFMNYKNPVEQGDLTAAEILNGWPEEDISGILKEYGEERFAKRIARNVVERRRRSPFKTTEDLVGVIADSVPGFYRHSRIHFATRTFQALRIAVNDELNALKEGLEKGWHLLRPFDKDQSRPGGRLVAISFHSLEDRIVKNFARDAYKKGGAEILTKKPVTASPEEIGENPRSRSAKLRAIKKI